MSVVLRDSSKKYISDWNENDKSIDVHSFGYTQSGTDYSLKYEETYKIYSNTSDVGRKVFGSWYDDTSQFAANAGVATNMFCNSSSVENGITKLANNRDFQVQYDGMYNIQFSAQVDQVSGSGQHIYIWFRKNGVDIPWSSSEVSVQGTNAESVPSWNFMVDMVAGDYLTIVYTVTSTNVYLKARPVFPLAPGIPSVIVTMWRL
jgi:hypothetical protein